MLQEEPELAAQWHTVYGDRVNKLVFIGIDMDRSRLISTLDACLLSDEEMNQDWTRFPDELPNAPAEQMETV